MIFFLLSIINFFYPFYFFSRYRSICRIPKSQKSYCIAIYLVRRTNITYTIRVRLYYYYDYVNTVLSTYICVRTIITIRLHVPSKLYIWTFYCCWIPTYDLWQHRKCRYIYYYLYVYIFTRIQSAARIVMIHLKIY